MQADSIEGAVRDDARWPARVLSAGEGGAVAAPAPRRDDAHGHAHAGHAHRNRCADADRGRRRLSQLRRRGADRLGVRDRPGAGRRGDARADRARECRRRSGISWCCSNCGLSRSGALVLNLALERCMAVVGGIVGYFAFEDAQHLTPYVLALAAASFIYIAVADLIPGLHRAMDARSTAWQIALIALGIVTVDAAQRVPRSLEAGIHVRSARPPARLRRHRSAARPGMAAPSRARTGSCSGLRAAARRTLLHILAGILQPTRGSVRVAGQELAALQASELDRFRGQHIGIVLQQLHLMATLTVKKNLLLAQYLAGLPQDRARVREVLASLDLADKAARVSARAFLRPGAARRGRARGREPAEAAARRRADFEPRRRALHAGARAAARPGARVQRDARDRDPRPAHHARASASSSACGAAA